MNLSMNNKPKVSLNLLESTNRFLASINEKRTSTNHSRFSATWISVTIILSSVFAMNVHAADICVNFMSLNQNLESQQLIKRVFKGPKASRILRYWSNMRQKVFQKFRWIQHMPFPSETKIQILSENNTLKTNSSSQAQPKNLLHIDLIIQAIEAIILM